MKNWKTTLFGVLTAVGMALQSNDNPTLKTIGTVLASVSALLLGATSKDHNITGV